MILKNDILSDWTEEFIINLQNSNSFCVALFSDTRDLLFANASMSLLLKDEPDKSFINPRFDEILLFDNSSSLIFEGFLTLGNYYAINSSIWVQIFRKNNKILVIGGVDSIQLLEQNKIMHQLNCQISNLQRELISEKHALENTLSQLNQININKDRFISILAHDLKNPFCSILGFLTLLNKNVRDYSIDKIEMQLKLVSDAAGNAYKLLVDILSWANAQSDKIPFNPEILELEYVCNAVIGNLNLSASNKNITISHFNIRNITVYADWDMLQTVLRNLISNAIKFTNSGGLISIYAEVNHQIVTIKISDNGIGINPKIKSKLFDIAQVISTDGTEDEKGTGLGLLISKEFIEKHEGEIWVESELGKGSDFFFTLPSKKI